MAMVRGGNTLKHHLKGGRRATVRIRESTIIHAPVRDVWWLLRDFNAHDRWHPAIATSHIKGGGPADAVGAIRNFRLTNGGTLREQLIRISDRDMSLSYCLLEAPVPLNDYVAHMRLLPVTDGNACFLEWWSAFNPPEAQRRALVSLVRDGVYRAGMTALQDWFSGKPQPIRQPVAAAPAPPPAPQRDTPKQPATGVFIDHYGGPEVLVARLIDVPAPGRGEVTLRQTFIGVNFIDIHCRKGHFPLVAPPGIPGMEAVGVVTATGPDVTHLRSGDRVGYACAPPGAYCSHRTMLAEKLIRLPRDANPTLSDPVIAGHLLRGITAGFLTGTVHPVQRGEVVLIHAAGGGLGQILVQWARHLGAVVIATASDPAKLQRAQDLGAETVINYSAVDFADAVLRATDGRGADVVFDGVGRATFAGSVAASAIRGHVVSLGEASGAIGDWNIDGLAARSLQVSRPNYGHFTRTGDEVNAYANRFFDLVQAGHIHLQKPQVLDLSDAAEAHRILESRQSDRPVVLQVTNPR